jgi:phosphoglucosamine mutase
LKLRDDVEADIEKRYLAYLDEPDTVNEPDTTNGASGAPSASASSGPSALTVGTSRPSQGVDGWIDLITGSVAPNALAGTTLVIDCANGAAFEHGPEPFRRLGAEVVVIGDTPNGTNINDGFGSTSTEALQAKVVSLGADAGLAFDGDADRLIAVDDTGAVVDGDRVLAIMAADWSATGRLRSNTVVVTVMSNLGFHRSMEQRGISVISTAVGDRNVLAALDDGSFSLGGEQSGHVICRDLASTGDGVLTGVQLLDVVGRSDRSLSSLAAEIMERVPQVLVNVRLKQREENPAAELQADIDQVTAEFGQDGRVLVRASGTEPLLRIMVEHVDDAVAAEAVDRLVAAANKRFG